MKYYGSGTYHSMITYRYSTTDGSMGTYPNTVADRYRLRRFYALISLLCHDRMTGTSEDYSRRNEAHVANRYWTRVKEGNSKVHICHAKEMGVESKVKVSAMLDYNLSVIRTVYLLEQILSALYIRRTGLIYSNTSSWGLFYLSCGIFIAWPMNPSLLLTSFIISSCVIMFIPLIPQHYNLTLFISS